MEHGSEDEEMEFGGLGENKPLLAGVCRDEGKERRSMLAGCLLFVVRRAGEYQ